MQNHSIVKKENLRLLSVVFSNGCNMDLYGGCSYCCIQSRNTSPILSLKEAIKFIETYYDSNSMPFIEIFGGEPMMYWHSRIKPLLEAIKGLKIRLYTNGLFDSSIMDDPVFINGVYEIIISHDGPGSFNSHRGISSREKVSNDTLATVDRAIELGLPVTIASVFSTKKHYLNIAENFNFFYEKGVRSFSFETMAVIKDDIINSNFNKEYLFSIIKFYYEYIIYGILTSSIDPVLINIPKEHINENINSIPCSEGVLAISPRGNLFRCRDSAANEENNLKLNRNESFVSVSSIKNAEKNNTCHVKTIQGYKAVVSSEENHMHFLLLKMTYNLMSTMNSSLDYYLLNGTLPSPTEEYLLKCYSLYTEYKKFEIFS